VLVGAGGAACAAAVALVEAEAEVTVVNRTASRAQAVARRAGAAWGGIDLLQRQRFDAVINATPVGMTGTPHAGETPFPAPWLAGDELVLDMVYRPRHTPLLRAAAARGCVTIEGLEMFVRQAAAQYGLLTGDHEEAPLALMRETAMRILDKDVSEANSSPPDGTV
jgi:shikimate 5-dehydrogenase